MSKIQLKHTIATNPTTTRGQSCQLNCSPDGTKLTYTTGNNVVIRDIANPNNARVFSEHLKTATVAKFSHSGNWIASGDETGTILIWNPEQEEQFVHTVKYTYRMIAGPIKDLAWCGENKRIVCVGDGGSHANSFMFDTGSKLGDFVGISKRLNSCDIRKNRPFRTIVGGDDFSSVFFEGPPVKFKKSNKDFSTYCSSVRFSNNGNHYAASGLDGSVFLYNGDDGENKISLTGNNPHKGGIYGISWNNADSHLVSASADKTVKIWDVNSMQASADITVGDQLGDQQLGVVWSSQGQIISVSLDGSLNYIDERIGKVAKKIYGPTNIITSLSRKSDGSFLASSGIDGNVYNYNDNFECQERKVHKTGHVQGVHVSSNENDFHTLATDNRIKFSGADFSSETPSASDIETETRPECSSSNGNVTVVGCIEKMLLIDNSTKSVLDETTINFTPKCVAINQQNQVVVSGEGSDKVKQYDVSGNKFVDNGTIKINGGANAMQFNKAGTILAVGDNQDKAIRLLDATNDFSVKASNFPHSSKVTALEWSPDDKYLASGELSTNIACWNTTAGKRKHVVKHAHRMSFVHSFMWQDDNTLLSAAHDGLIKQWTVDF